VQREPERRDDAEVAAAASQRPEQIGVLVGGCLDDAAFGGDNLGGKQVVDGEQQTYRESGVSIVVRCAATRSTARSPRPPKSLATVGRF
jgi:hypothetical protein